MQKRCDEQMVEKNTTQKTKDGVTRSSLKNKSSGGVISFCSTSGACPVFPQM